MNKWTLLFFVGVLSACEAPDTQWHLALKHDSQGVVQEGGINELISAVRLGCNIRVAWGARRRADSTRTIEHIANPVWVSIRDGQSVEVQLDDFMINLSVLGNPPEEHPEREPYGGTERAVMWRANLKTDGSFDAVWYDAANGEFITRVPQQHPMSWFVDCIPGEAEPLFP
ncbi:MAG: hypothetical protein KTR29_18920 [Rhodothermaceae bacterium]|nr:hypothetical protein [Rhodothermaceae bacterium]